FVLPPSRAVFPPLKCSNSSSLHLITSLRLFISSLRGSLLDHLDVEDDGNLVANRGRIIIHDGIALDAKVLTINFCGRCGANPVIAVGAFVRMRRAVNHKNNFLGDAANGEVTGYREPAYTDALYLRRLERNRGIMRNVEESIAA